MSVDQELHSLKTSLERMKETGRTSKGCETITEGMTYMYWKYQEKKERDINI